MKNFLIVLVCILLCNIVPSFAASYTQLTSGINEVILIKSYKDVGKNFIVIEKMKRIAKNLSQDDKNIILKYVFGAVKGENTYLLMNGYLRGDLHLYIKKQDITKPLKSRMQYYADSLSSSISKTKLPKNMLLYRGVDEKGMGSIFADKDIKDVLSKPVSYENTNYIKNKINGYVFTEKGFMSTSYDINYAKKTKFIFYVKAPKNLQAVFVDGVRTSNEAQTKEIIINNGYKWKVTDVDFVLRKDGSKYYKITLKLVLKEGLLYDWRRREYNGKYICGIYRRRAGRSRKIFDYAIYSYKIRVVSDCDIVC
ncbi:hypothetical protein IKQ21_09615 [bacterium]|nr:hypothetical protein [bacterium]